MKAIKHTNFKEAIVKLKILDDGTLLVVDSKTTVRFLNIETLKVVNGFKANIVHQRYKNNIIEFSTHGDYFMVLSADCNETLLFNAKTKKNIFKVSRHQGEASCVAIDPTNKYAFSCGDDGRTYAVKISSNTISFTMPTHADTVNDIAFSNNGHWIATASYDKKIHIFDMTTMGRKHRLIGHSSAVMKIKFLSDNRLFSVDKNNKCIIWDYNKGKVLVRLNAIHDDVLHVAISKDNKFVFLGTQLGYIVVYELETYTLLTSKYIKMTSSITSLSFDDEKSELILGTKNGDVCFYNIYEGQKYIKELLQEKHYGEIENYIEKNPLLAYTEIYGFMQTIWEATLKKAKLYLEQGKNELAKKLFKNFKNVKSKNIIIQRVMMSYADFAKFRNMAQNQKLPLAYSLANQNPIFKESLIYKQLERQWKQTFIQAQKYAISHKNAHMAKNILIPYRGISKKTRLIQDLLTQGEVCKRFRIAISQKDFKIAFETVKLYPFLKEFADYERLMKYADTLYVEAQKQLKNNNTHSALKILRILIDFGDFREVASELIKQIEDTQKFYNAIENDDIVLAYKLLDENEELQNSEKGIELLQDWKDTLIKADEFSLNADIDGLNNIMKKYLNINSKSNSLANLYGWCYMVQLENAVRESKEQVVLENGIKNYILFFGLQEQIENLFIIFQEKYPNTKLKLSSQAKGSIEMWRTSMIVKSILG